MESVDLEARIAALETAVEADLELDRLEAKVKSLETDPSIKKLFRSIERHDSVFNLTKPHSKHIALEQQADLVLGHTAQIKTVEAQLARLQTLKVPSLATSNLLVSKLPEVREIYEICQSQETEIERLSLRTLALLDEWYRLHVRPTNQAMVDIEKSVRQARRLANTRERD